jgi:hypothetical protein
MSTLSTTEQSQPYETSVPTLLDSATTQTLMTLRLTERAQAIAPFEATRRYTTTDPTATLPTSRVSR